jgi:hypothetical protein
MYILVAMDEDKKVVEGEVEEVTTEEVAPEEIQTEEVVEEEEMSMPEIPPLNASVTGGGSAEVLINMESMIKNYVASIDKLQIGIKKHKEMLDDIFTNSPAYKDHSEKAKEAAKLLASTKGQILRQPQASELSNSMKDMRVELKENQEALSDYLQEYARMSGVNEIEDDDGEDAGEDIGIPP